MGRSLIIGMIGRKTQLSNRAYHHCSETKFVCKTDEVGFVLNEVMQKYPHINKWSVEPNVEDWEIKEEYEWVKITKDINKKFRLNKGCYEQMWMNVK